MAATEETPHIGSPQLLSVHSQSPSLSPVPENGNPKFPDFDSLSSDKTAELSNLKYTRKSPRLIGNGEASNGSSRDKGNSRISNTPPAKKQKSSDPSKNSRKMSGTASFFVGDPVSDEEARQRWPWRYRLKGQQNEAYTSKTNNDDDEDPLVLNVRCHYSQAKVEKCVFNLGDCAYVKGERRDQNYVGKILEFFQTIDGEDYFRVQWFFRAEDTVIKDEGKLHDKKRLFYSTLMNDNLLDCIVSKVNVLPIAPSVHLKSKSLPHCDFYYDMKYSVEYSTFCTDNSNIIASPHMKETHQNGTNGNLEETSTYEPLKSELALLDLYSGCGGMSTGLCLGAKVSNVDLVTKWAVEIDKSACESLKLNHPETQIRNESTDDFLDLLKEWEKLCKRYVKDLEPNSRLKRGADKNVYIKPDNQIPSDEYEVGSLVDICYGVCDKTTKRGLKFQVRWVGYSPSEDTWEPIENLNNCQDKIRDFVLKGVKAKILPRPGDVDVICGGPPCQGISGYNRFRNVDSPLECERNRQIVVFMDIINFLRPKYILMENVADILKFANGCLGRYALSRLVDMKYQARLGIMAAGCYGLPQFRLRVFLWGAHPQEKLPQFPLPTHDVVLRYGAPTAFERNIVAYDEGQPRDLEKALTLSDAISDLPPVTNMEVRAKMSYRKQPETEFQKYIRATKSDMLGFSSSHKTRAEKCLLYDHRPLPLLSDDYKRVCRIPKRKGANFRDLPGVIVGADNLVRRTDDPALMPSGKQWVPDYAMNFGHGKSKRPFARLWWDETVPTVLCMPDCHSQAILHPEQDRVLTVREYARLQGFHDYYEFCGDLKERYGQVGNAVALPVGRALGYAMGMAVRKLGGDEPLMTLPPKFSHSTTTQLLHSFDQQLQKKKL